MNVQPNSFTRTKRKIVPYTFTRLPSGKIQISMLRGQILIVSRDQAERILKHEDLDMQRRKMYQDALEEWKKTDG